VCATPAGRPRSGCHRVCLRCGCRFRNPAALPLPTRTGGASPDLPGLADTLPVRWLGDQPGRALLLGGRLPALTRHLQARGWAIDPLGLTLTPADFAGTSSGQARRWGTFQLIALVGFFERLGDPLAALGRLRDLTAEDGRVFLRLPDPDLPGFGLHPELATLPIQLGLDGVLELLAQGGDRFTLAATRVLAGAGRRDLVLRPVKANPGPGWEPGLETFARTGAARPGPGPAPKVPAVALFRPGAIGDVVVTLNLVPALRQRFPGHLVHYFCHRWIGAQLEPLMQLAGVTAWKDMAEFQDRAGDYAATFVLEGYPLGEGFPRRPMARHLLQYFAEELGLDPGELPALPVALPPLAGLPGPYATLHPTARWSVYKNWPLERWAKVLRACPDIPVYQIGAAEDPPVPGARHDFLGTPLMTAVALVANARVHLGVDSFTNHLSHYRWNGRQVPSVILWGSTQSTATGYPHNVNLSLGLPCQPCFREDATLSMFPQGLGPCPNPPGQTYQAPRHACMDGIPVARVAAELRRLWDGAEA
jgi:ADP-heptose:LPS heptosyltransferase